MTTHKEPEVTINPSSPNGLPYIGDPRPEWTFPTTTGPLMPTPPAPVWTGPSPTKVAIPLGGSPVRWASLELPANMTTAEWALMGAILAAMQRGIVVPDPPAPVVAKPKAHPAEQADPMPKNADR